MCGRSMPPPWGIMVMGCWTAALPPCGLVWSAGAAPPVVWCGVVFGPLHPLWSGVVLARPSLSCGVVLGPLRASVVWCLIHRPPLGCSVVWLSLLALGP